MTDDELRVAFHEATAKMTHWRIVRDDAIREHAKDHSLRATAVAVGLSHSAIAKIVKWPIPSVGRIPEPMPNEGA